MSVRRTTFGSHIIGLVLVGTALAAANHEAFGQTFPLNGTVRDFKRTDLNFAVTPVGGNGHYAGNLAMTLDANGRPMFVGGGKKVTVEWMDQDGHAIAPHLLMQAGEGGAGGVMLVEAPVIRNNPIIDTYDPAMGPYDVATAGPAPEFLTGSAMPELVEPILDDASCGLPHSCGNQPITLSGPIRTHGDLCLGNNRLYQVSGEVVIVCDGEFRVKNHARVELMEGATLTVYAREGMRIENNSRLNMNTGDASRVTLNNLGECDVRISNTAQACARIVSPAGVLRMKNTAQLYGKFTGFSMELRNQVGLHIEAGTSICGREPNDVAGVYGTMSSGGIPSPMAFSTWFTDVPGVNMSRPHTITLQRAFSGTLWQYNTSGFYPVDGALFGNQGQLHNNYFTYATEVRFIHRQCTGRYFEFLGNDDAWLFVNGALVMDRGGVQMPAVPQYVEFDRLGLVDGQEYVMHFFHAQRNAVSSSFRIRTNLELVSAVAH